MFLHKEACDSDFWLNLLLTIVTVRAGCLHGPTVQYKPVHAWADMCPLPCLQFWILGECLIYGVPTLLSSESLAGLLEP